MYKVHLAVPDRALAIREVLAVRKMHAPVPSQPWRVWVVSGSRGGPVFSGLGVSGGAGIDGGDDVAVETGGPNPVTGPTRYTGLVTWQSSRRRLPID